MGQREIEGLVFISVSEQISIHGRFRKNDIALIEGARELSWAQYNDAANSLAARLNAQGVIRGNRIGLLVANGLWAHEALLATWRCGAAAVPLSPMLKAAQLRVMLEDAGCIALLASPAYEQLAHEASGTLPVLTVSSLAALKESPEFIPYCPEREDLAVIIYSSGTTGLPKGIAHSHESRFNFASNFAAQFRFNARSVALSCIPMHSNGAWLSWLPANWVGATTIILPAFSADAYLEIVRMHAPTHGFAVPTMASALIQHPDIERIRLECFETLITAGSPMPANVKRAIQALSNHALFELWGLTEGVATIITPEEMKLHPESVGRPMLGCDIRILDAEDCDVTETGCGEIVGYSSGMMDGYWNRPDADAAATWLDQNGRYYLRTGDLGEFDAQGFLTLRGRKKDMILSGGLNVFPVDIEAQLLDCAGIREAVVFGIEDQHWGEIPVALVHPDPTAAIEAPRLMSEVNGKLARHQRLKDLVLWPTAFPKNSMGKVPKAELRETYLLDHRGTR